MSKKILVVDDNRSTLKVIKAILTQEKYTVFTTPSPAEALEIIVETGADACLVDLKMPEMNGMELYKKIKKAAPGIYVIIMTAYGTVESAVGAMKLGAENYIQKPLNFEELKIIIAKIFEKIRMRDELELLRGHLEGEGVFQNMIGRSKRMRDVFKKIKNIAASEVTLLITGESGTGKEMAARAIHNLSKRKKGKLIAINLAAIPEGLQESELFGYEKGAFTGAYAPRTGKFAAADNGTVFLDEVGNINYKVQAKLLRVLEDKKIMPLGSDKEKSVDVRIISATNADLKEEVKSGRFREDLFYRLNVILLKIPPLRERRADIPLLAQYFLREVCAKNDMEEKMISDRAMEKLVSYDWPGNIRELRNAIEEAAIVSSVRVIEPEELNLRSSAEEIFDTAGKNGKIPSNMPLPELEKKAIINALKNTGGNQTRAAKLIGISRKKIMKKIEKHKLFDVVPIRTKKQKKSQKGH